MKAFLAILLIAIPCLSQPPGKAVKPPDYKKLAQTRVASVLESITKDADFTRATKDLTTLFDELIAYAPDSETDAFREADFGLRLVTQLSQVKTGRTDLLTYLRANPELAQALVFQIQPEDKIPAVYALLNKLQQKHGKELNKLASLTAAICVVHDQPLVDQVNENTAKAADPVQIFDYFKTHQGSMHFPLTSMPPELLVFVVNTTASIDDLNWALNKYAGDARVNRRYSEVHYDKAYFRGQAEKKVTVAGFNLPSILKNGGVCADQSYFAQQVGKAIGVPTAGISGRNASMAHAWVGFFEVISEKPRWNFDAGHYEGYENVRGSTLDPQTRQTIPDSALCLIADTSASGTANRRAAIAMTDASLRLAAIQKAKGANYPPTGETVIPIRNPARQADIAGRMGLLEAGLRKSPALAQGWSVVSTSATELSLKDKQHWAGVLDSLCGTKNPDFTLGILTTMVKAIPSIQDQDAFWSSLFNTYQKRPDLAAEVRFCQGGMWEKSGDKAKAWTCYEDVFKRFPNKGPFAVEAAQRCEKLMKDGGKAASALYAALWPRMERPGASISQEFKQQSNWYRVGKLYASSLESEGNLPLAESVKKQLDR